jgi:hypothetical protein
MAAPASAATINSLLSPAGDTYQLSDNSAERLINGATSTGATTLDVGDRLRGVLAINTIENLTTGAASTTIGNGTANSELTAIFDVTVLTKTGSAATGWTFTFGATASFASDPLLAGFTGSKTNAAAAFFEDTGAKDFIRSGTVAAGETSATNGTPYWLFGLTGDDFWTATSASDDVTALPPPGSNIANFNIGLSLLLNPNGPLLSPRSCFNQVGGVLATVDTCASGDVVPKGSTSGFDVYDNVDFTLSPAAVPEPGTLALFGTALLGWAGLRRRKARK